MARIRTIKPEFFTSEDICALSPLARLYYQACWCEADKEGRLEWKPRTMKLRYFPGDDCDIDAIAAEIVRREIVVLYEVDGRTLAEIPAFSRHQHINPRESASLLPPRVTTRQDASNLELTHREEGKGREGKTPPTDSSLRSLPASPTGENAEAPLEPKPKLNPARGQRWPDGQTVPEEWRSKMRSVIADRGLPSLDIDIEAVKFANFWIAKPGAGGRKCDWQRTWINWCLTACSRTPQRRAS